MFCEVTMNAELANTIAAMGDIGLGSRESLVTTFFGYQSICNLVLCVFLLTDTCFNIYCRLIILNNSWPTTPQLMPE